MREHTSAPEESRGTSFSESDWVNLIRTGDKKAFQQLFSRYYSPLCAFITEMVGSSDAAREIVQEVFVRIWERRENWVLRGDLKPYLYQAVRNQALNRITGERARKSALSRLHISSASREAESIEDQIRKKELTGAIWRVVEQLPERRRLIFILFHRHALSYNEIAQTLGISRKTVENQMGQALKFIRDVLQDHLS